jgi:uncharacterized membrane protein YphA (DoxX/SURF4 family)
MNNYYTLLGRAGLAAIFIPSGWGKISGYAGTQEYMASAGVPAAHGSGAFSVDALLAKRVGSFPSSGRVTS